MNQTQRLTRSLKTFGSFQRGWSFGEGLPVDAGVIDRLESLVIKAERESLQADVFPGLNGEGAISFYLANPQGEFHSIEVVITPEGTYDIHIERGKGFNPTHLVSGENFTEVDAGEMIDAWIDHVRSGRSHSPVKPVSFV